jgi:Family of unknown function (DUF6152)
MHPRTRPKLLLLAAGGVLVPTAGFAHHSRAAFDMTREVVVEGTVARLDWMNPHIYFAVETQGPNGERMLQEIEAVSVSEASVLGLRKEAIAPGARVVVRAHPNRVAAGGRVSGLDVKTSDGAVHPLNTDAKLTVPHAVVPLAQGLAGHWAATLESFMAVFPVVQSWLLTDAGRAAQADAIQKFAVASDVAALGICEPFPPPMLSVYPDVRTIELGDSTIVMRFEGAVGVPMERVIHLDQAAHPAGAAPSLMGHSIGHWEGQTLVIDTVAFTPYRFGLMLDPSSPDKHLIERLTLAEDSRHLEYVVTVEDPKYLAAPGSFTATWDYRPDLDLSGVPCDPETARRPLTH